jgi:hypothetical protein
MSLSILVKFAACGVFLVGIILYTRTLLRKGYSVLGITLLYAGFLLLIVVMFVAVIIAVDRRAHQRLNLDGVPPRLARSLFAVSFRDRYMLLMGAESRLQTGLSLLSIRFPMFFCNFSVCARESRRCCTPRTVCECIEAICCVPTLN